MPGILAAEDDETIAAMYKNGHKIGSNTLKGSKHLENYSQEELVKDFALANNIIETWTKPHLIFCYAILQIIPLKSCRQPLPVETKSSKKYTFSKLSKL